jgi:hypothetical protein
MEIANMATAALAILGVRIRVGGKSAGTGTGRCRQAVRAGRMPSPPAGPRLAPTLTRRLDEQPPRAPASTT